MNQQQLQIARAALWHQTAATDAAAPLRTLDDAARFLDEAGLCLFLPRHTQLPAPAPSFVEACLGAPSVTPAPAAIATATEFATRLIGERRLIPLNLLGTFSEQPDFLVTVDVLPWVAAVRGDRQWKAAPTGRPAPIVLRTWEALDREGERTAVELRELLGRELTEAAVLRALIELWTSLRAMPVYAPDEPTRWTLLKTRFPAQLATAANTAQTTALSALLSLYLRSAVAATAEEAEIFLSPLTARSRIREVLHGMMATRQFLTTTVASQTLLFLEGSLPEALPSAEPEAQAAPAPAPPAPRPPFRKQPHATRWELPSRPQADRSRPWQKKPAAAHRPEPAADGETERQPEQGPERRPERGERAGQPFRGARPGPRLGQRTGGGAGARTGSRTGPRTDRPGAKPWERRPQAPFRKQEFRKQEFRKQEFRKQEFRRPDGEGSGEQPAARPPRDPRWRGKTSGAPRSGGNRPWQKSRPGSGPGRDQGPPFRPRPDAGPRPEGDRSARGDAARPERKFGGKPGGKFGGKPGFGRPRPAGPRRPEGDRAARGDAARPERKFGGKPGGKFGGKPAFGRPRPAGPRRPEGDRTARGDAARPERKFGGKPGGKFGGKPGFARPRPAGPGKRAFGKSRSGGPTGGSTGGSGRPFRPGKFSLGKPNRPSSRGAGSGRPVTPKNKFRKPTPGERNPRKNRNQKEDPE